MSKSPALVFAELVSDATETLETICSHVASGGALTDLARTWGARFDDLMRWIRSDATRSQRYNIALQDRAEWCKETILHEIKRIAVSDIRQIFDERGAIKPAHEWPDDLAACIQSIDVVEEKDGKHFVGWNKKIKLWNKEKAIELLGKHLALFVDKHEVLVTKLEDLIGESMQHDQIIGDYSRGSEGSDSTDDDRRN